MCEWSRTVKRSYEEAARKLAAGGWERRKVRGEVVKEVFVKDGHAVYLGRKLGEAQFTTYPCELSNG